MDFVSLVLTYITIVAWIVFVAYHSRHIVSASETDLSDPDTLNSFYRVAQLHKLFLGICSFNLILIFTKVLRYLSVWFERVSILFNTIKHASSDLIAFIIMYTIILFAFTLMAHIFYGSTISAFRSTLWSAITLFRFILSDYGEVMQSMFGFGY